MQQIKLTSTIFYQTITTDKFTVIGSIHPLYQYSSQNKLLGYRYHKTTRTHSQNSRLRKVSKPMHSEKLIYSLKTAFLLPTHSERNYIYTGLRYIMTTNFCNHFRHWTLHLWLPFTADADILFCSRGNYLSSFVFFPSPMLSSRKVDVYHTSTHDVASANLECRSEMCCAQLAENTGRKKSPSVHHRTTLSGYIFATKAYVSTIGKNC